MTAATTIDLVGADLYDPNSALYQEMLRAFRRPDDSLWISETDLPDNYAKFFFYALGDGAIGFSTFDIDHTRWTLSDDQPPKHTRKTMRFSHQRGVRLLRLRDWPPQLYGSRCGSGMETRPSVV